MPPQTFQDEMAPNRSMVAKEPCEQKLFYKERSGLLSSNCIYQIQKVLARLFIGW